MFIFVFFLETLQFLWLFASTSFWEMVYMVCRNRPRKDIKDSHILITGTSQGLGKLLAKKLASNGNTLHLVDINTTLNEENIKELTSDECKVFTYHCDIGKLDSILALKENVFKNCNKVDYLFNNAGVIVGKLFPETSLKEMNLVMSVDAIGVMNMTQIFLPEMMEHGGHLIFVSSIAGCVGAPFMTTYTAAKHAVTGFSRSLLFDLDYMGVDHVKVTTVFPHFTNTGMFSGASVKMPMLFPMLEPDYVAEQIVIATREERNELILPRVTNYVVVYVYLMECRVFRAYCKLLGNDLMKTFRQTRDVTIQGAIQNGA